MINANTTPTSIPVRKVTVGAFSGALVTLTVLVLNNYVSSFKEKPITPEMTGTAITIVTFIVSYLVPPDQRETTVQDQEGNTISARKTI
jgi:hypothetical protein